MVAAAISVGVVSVVNTSVICVVEIIIAIVPISTGHIVTTAIVVAAAHSLGSAHYSLLRCPCALRLPTWSSGITQGALCVLIMCRPWTRS